jgi:hypothetical protein
MDGELNPSVIVLTVVFAIIGLAIQWWIIVTAVRRALADHTIWRYTKWHEVKKGIDEGRLDHRGFPTK